MNINFKTFAIMMIRFLIMKVKIQCFVLRNKTSKKIGFLTAF